MKRFLCHWQCIIARENDIAFRVYGSTEPARDAIVGNQDIIAENRLSDNERRGSVYHVFFVLLEVDGAMMPDPMISVPRYSTSAWPGVIPGSAEAKRKEPRKPFLLK